MPDPERDVLLVRYALSGIDASVSAFLATHLQTPPSSSDWSGGSDNFGWVDPGSGTLRAALSGGTRNLCLVGDQGFARTNVGYFGSSDMWQDFAQHNGHMLWSYTDAWPGFIVLSAQLGQPSGVLALALATDEAAAATLAE